MLVHSTCPNAADAGSATRNIPSEKEGSNAVRYLCQEAGDHTVFVVSFRKWPTEHHIKGPAANLGPSAGTLE